MELEKFYLKLPDFIKYNPKILKFCLNISRKVNSRYDVESSQYYLLNLLFVDCDIKIKGTRRKIQLLYVELLRFVANVCDKYDIDYWLDFGTLLGAVRHGGFIPWDDDIDLAMLREDYNKLIEVLPIELNKFDKLDEYIGLTLLLEDEKNYFSEFKSVYDAVDNDENQIPEGRFNFLQIAWLKPFVKIDFFPMDFILDEKVDEINETFLPVKYKFHFDLLDNKFEFFDELNSQRSKVGFTDNQTNYFSDTFESVPHWRVRIFEYNKTFPLTSINFEGYEFKAPKDLSHHLNVVFGENYMNLPKIIENHDILGFIETQFNSKQEMDNAFDEAISILREINDNF